MEKQAQQETNKNISLHSIPVHVNDICEGADPFVFKQNGKWHLLVQGDLDATPSGHDGIKGYTLRSAGRLEDLSESASTRLVVSSQPDNLRQAWAAEIHEQYMYVAISNGDNATHRMHIYMTEHDAYGPWRYVGPMIPPDEDDNWAIDMTLAKISHRGAEKIYAVWSGWEKKTAEILPDELFAKVIPQHIYIAELISSTKIGKRHLLASPKDTWCTSVEPILEGPQALVISGEFKGFIVAGNASWTTKYATNILKYLGGEPLDHASWVMGNPLFVDGHGIGHGMFVEDNKKLYYVGHRKTHLENGWTDRVVFFAEIPRTAFEAYLNGETKETFYPVFLQ